jgi:hypothetical protein
MAFRRQFELLPQREFDELMQVIGSCKEAGEKRNQVMHGHFHRVNSEGPPVLRHSRTGKLVDASKEALSDLAEDAANLAVKCYELIDSFRFLLEGVGD